MQLIEFIAVSLHRRRPKVPNDNHTEFMQRLDDATNNLSNRRASLIQARTLVTSLFEQNNTGLDLWAQRRSHISELQAQCLQTTDGRALSELHNVAIKLEVTFKKRAGRLSDKLSDLKARCDDTERALLELKKSKDKLNSNRMLAKDRLNLSSAVAEIAGGPDGMASAFPDGGLRNDLKDARKAVILAEALIEVKGN